MNKEKFEEITKRIRNARSSEIEEIIKKNKPNGDIDKSVNRGVLTATIGYDEKLCGNIGISNENFIFLPPPIIRRIKAYAILLTNEDINFKFPYKI